MSDFLSMTIGDVITIICGIVAAVFAALAYRLQLVIARKKLIFVTRHRRNDSHVSVTATNEGKTVVIRSVELLSKVGRRIKFNRFSDPLEHGTCIDFVIDVSAFDDISVDVEFRFIVSLSDGSTLSTSAFSLREMIDFENRIKETVVIRTATNVN